MVIWPCTNVFYVHLRCCGLTVFRVHWTLPASLYSCMFHIHLTAYSFRCVPRIGSEPFFKLFLEWPSGSHDVQPCCLCAVACVIQFEWRKPRDTSVVLSWLGSYAFHRRFFDGANLKALRMKRKWPEGRNGSSQQTTQEQPCVVCICINRAKLLPDKGFPEQSASSCYLWGPTHYLNFNSDPHKAGINGHQIISGRCGLLWVNQETEHYDGVKRAVIMEYFEIQPIS